MGTGKHIFFSDHTWERLQKFLHRFLGGRGLSIVVDKAVAEWLDNHENTGINDATKKTVASRKGRGIS